MPRMGNESVSSGQYAYAGAGGYAAGYAAHRFLSLGPDLLPVYTAAAAMAAFYLYGDAINLEVYKAMMAGSMGVPVSPAFSAPHR